MLKLWFQILFMVSVFMHILADFNLQGILAKFKQAEFWEKEHPGKKNRYAFVVCILYHSFMWAFLVVIPYFIYGLAAGMFSDILVSFTVTLVYVNMAIHAIIDDLKVNVDECIKIGFVTDQLLHLLQLVMTCVVFYIVMSLAY